jgi:glycosyltransferase involved in cell wall biosynthesis
LKILIDASNLTIGGSVQVGLAFLQNAAITPSLEWHVIVSKTLDRQISEGVIGAMKTWISLPSDTRCQKIASQKQIRKIGESIQPDLVITIFGPTIYCFTAPHLQGFALPTLLYPETKLPNANILHRWRDRIIDQYKRCLLKYADYLMVETEVVRQRVEYHLGFPSERIIVIRNSYSPIFEDVILKLPPKVLSEKVSILVPSSYYLHKNLEIIPSVAKSLRESMKKDFEFVFTLDQNEYGWKRIRNLAERLNVCDLIRTAGSVPHKNIPNLYHMADAVFLPTLLECSTAVYPESFMARVPLATSDLDFAHSLCADAAIYFDPYDHVSAASALAKLITDQGTGSILVENGLMVLRKNYPTPEEKWNDQLRCMQQVVSCGTKRKTGRRNQ